MQRQYCKNKRIRTPQAPPEKKSGGPGPPSSATYDTRLFDAIKKRMGLLM